MLEVRYLEGGAADRAAELAKELIDSGAEVIVTGNPTAIVGGRRATTTVPIVMAGVGTDPVASGWVTSLARPGGNVTGLSFQVPTLPGRRLQLLREITTATRIGLLHDATGPDNALTDVEAAAKALGIGLQVVIAKGTSDIDAAFAASAPRASSSSIECRLALPAPCGLPRSRPPIGRDSFGIQKPRS